MERGQVEVLSIDPIQIKDITSAMATESGFDSVADLLTTARHGSGTNVYFIRFRYIKAPRILDE